MLSASLLEAFDQELLKSALGNRGSTTPSTKTGGSSGGSSLPATQSAVADGALLGSNGGSSRASRRKCSSRGSKADARRIGAEVREVDRVVAHPQPTSSGVAGPVVPSARQAEPRMVRFSSEVEACTADKHDGGEGPPLGPQQYKPGASPTRSAMKRASFVGESGAPTTEVERSYSSPSRDEPAQVALADAPDVAVLPSAATGSFVALASTDALTANVPEATAAHTPEQAAVGREMASPWDRLMSRSRRDDIVQRVREAEEQKLRESCTFTPKLSARTRKQIVMERRMAQIARNSGSHPGSVAAARFDNIRPSTDAIQPPLALRRFGSLSAEALPSVDELHSEESNPTSGVVTPVDPTVPSFPSAVSLLSSRQSAPHLPLFAEAQGNTKRQRVMQVDERHPQALRRESPLRSPSFVQRLSSPRHSAARLSHDALHQRSTTDGADAVGSGRLRAGNVDQGASLSSGHDGAMRGQRNAPTTVPQRSRHHSTKSDRAVSPSSVRLDRSSPRRSIDDLFQWEASRQESLCALRQQVTQEQLAAQAAKEAEWRNAVPRHQSPGNVKVLRSLGDRRITAVEHASMVAAARRQQLLQENEQRHHHTGRAHTPATSQTRRHTSVGELPQPAAAIHQDPQNVLQWWVALAHSDPAYVRNR